MKKLICLLLSISVAFFALTAGCGGEESPAHEHEFERVSAVAATCTQNGNPEYRHCKSCGKNFSDETGETEITVLITPPLGHDYSEGFCSRCGTPDKNAPDTQGLEFAPNAQGDAYSLTGLGTADSGFIKIPSEYEGKPVTAVAAKAFYGNETVKAVYLPDCVATIDKQAFAMSEISSVILGKNLKSVASNAFQLCIELTRVTFNGDLSDWLEITFANIYANPLIHAHALYLGDSLLTDAVIPQSVTKINPYAFYGCSSVRNVTFHTGVLEIGNGAFKDCSSLKAANLSSVTAIGDSAFNGCAALAEVTLGDGLVSLGTAAFTGCDKLKYSSYGGGLYLGSGNNKYKVLVKSAEGATSCEVNANAEIIASFAFDGCESLQSLTVPEGVKSVGEAAFANCIGLKTIVWNAVSATTPLSAAFSAVTPAFDGCSGISSVTFGENVTSVPDGMLQNSGVKSIALGGNITSIGKYAFSGCAYLTEIALTDAVTLINQYAFSGCQKLTAIRFDGVTDKWKAIKKNTYWSRNTGDFTVFCSDGNLDSKGNPV